MQCTPQAGADVPLRRLLHDHQPALPALRARRRRRGGHPCPGCRARPAAAPTAAWPTSWPTASPAWFRACPSRYIHAGCAIAALDDVENAARRVREQRCRGSPPRRPRSSRACGRRGPWDPGRPRHLAMQDSSRCEAPRQVRKDPPRGLRVLRVRAEGQRDSGACGRVQQRGGGRPQKAGAPPIDGVRRRLEEFAASFRRYLGAYAPYSVSRLRENGSERLRIRPSGRRQLRPSEKTPGRNHISLAKYY